MGEGRERAEQGAGWWQKAPGKVQEPPRRGTERARSCDPEAAGRHMAEGTVSSIGSCGVAIAQVQAEALMGDRNRFP